MILETKYIDSDGKEYIVNNNNNGTGVKLIAAFIVTIIVSVLVGAGGLLLFFHFNPEYVSKKVTVSNINYLIQYGRIDKTITDRGLCVSKNRNQI